MIEASLKTSATQAAASAALARQFDQDGFVVSRTFFSVLSGLALALSSQLALAQTKADRPVIDDNFVRDRVLGDYVDTTNGVRMWIADGEVRRIRLEAGRREDGVPNALVRRQLIRATMELPSKTDGAALHRVLAKLKDNGITVTCARTPIRFLAGNAAAQAAVFRYLGGKEEDAVDVRLQLSTGWAVTYVSYRSRELARFGTLPAHGDAESERMGTSPLDDLPFTAPSIVYRMSGDQRPLVDWCRP